MAADDPLQKHIESDRDTLERIAAKFETHARYDIESGLTAVRKAAEAAMWGLYTRRFERRPKSAPKPTLQWFIEQARHQQGFLSQTLVLHLNIIRDLGNYGAHPQAEEPEEETLIAAVAAFDHVRRHFYQELFPEQRKPDRLHQSGLFSLKELGMYEEGRQETIRVTQDEKTRRRSKRPTSLDERIDRLRSLVILGDEEMIINVAEKILTEDPKQQEARREYALALDRMGENEDALTAYRPLLEARPDFPLFLCEFGVLCVKAYELDADNVKARKLAESAYKRALDLLDRDGHETYFIQVGRALCSLTDFADRKLARRIADYYLRTGQPRHALRYITNADTKKPETVDLLIRFFEAVDEPEKAALCRDLLVNT